MRGMQRIGAAAIVALATTSLPSLAYAQAAQEQPQASQDEQQGIGEIIVQARRRSESSQNVGASITALSAADLAKTGATNVQEVVYSIPNASVNYGIGNTSFNLRGIGSNEFSTNLDSPIATQVDEVYISKVFMTGLFNFDLDHVEANNGPQGTLFGRNATGGVMNFFTKKPEMNFAAGGTVEYGNYNTLRGEGYLNLPLGEDLAVRVSGFGVHQGKGFYKNTNLNITQGFDRKWALRGQLAYNGGTTNALLSLHFGEDNSSLPPYQGTGIYTPASYTANAAAPYGIIGNIVASGAIFGMTLCPQYIAGDVAGASVNCVRGHDGLALGTADPFVTKSHDPYLTHNRSFGGLFRVDHDFGGATLTSLTGYEYFKKVQNEVGDGSPLYGGVELFWFTTIKQYSQELRLNSNGSGKFNYVLGAYYQHDDLYNGDYLTIGTNATPFVAGFKTSFTQKNDAFALFGNATVDVSDRFKLITGVRFNHESASINGGTCLGGGISGGLSAAGGTQSVEQSPTAIFTCASPNGSSTSLPLNLGGKIGVGGLPVETAGNTRKDTNVSFKAGFEWRPDMPSFDNFMVYGTVSTGFRSGGFSADLVTAQGDLISLKPEEITAYELGLKSDFGGRTLRFNAAVFHYDITNAYLRTDSPASLVPKTVNAAKVSITGADASFSWAPVTGLRFDLSGGWVHSRILDHLPYFQGFANQAPIAGDAYGNRTATSPEFTFNGAVNYTTELGNGLKLDTNFNANWRSSQFLDMTNVAAVKEPGYWLANASVGIGASDDRWKVTAFARNLTNTTFRTYVNNLVPFGWLLNQYGPPRTYGVRLNVKF